MKLLITGSTGFVGGHLVERLCRKEGVQLRLLVRPGSNRKILSSLPVEFVEGSLSDESSLKAAVEGVDQVIHVAGRVAGKSAKDFFEANTEGTKNLAEAFRAQASGKKRKRFIFISSLAASGPGTTKLPKTEKSSDEPISDYGKSKKAAEELLQDFQKDFDVAVLRPPLVYGPRDLGVFKIFQMAIQPIGLIPRGDNPEAQKFYSLVHVEDLVLAIENLIFCESLKSAYVRYYVAGDEVVSLRELLEETCRVLDRSSFRLSVPPFVVRGVKKALVLMGGQLPLVGGGRVNVDKLREVEADYWLCSNERIKEELGFKPQWPWKRGVNETLRWYQEERWL